MELKCLNIYVLMAYKFLDISTVAYISKHIKCIYILNIPNFTKH